MSNADRAQQGGDGQHGGNSRAVVGNSGPVNAASLLADIQRRVRGKNRVNVGAEGYIPLAEAGMNAENISHIIDANVVQSGLAKALG